MKTIWLWRLGVLLFWVGWFQLTAPLSPLDTWGFDVFLKLKAPLAPPVSTRIAYLDITEEQLDRWSDTREEYDGIAELMELLRRQGTQVIALDLLLIRGKDQDFAKFWEQVLDHVDVVLGRTTTESSHLPAGQEQMAGLLNLFPDPDGKLRRYTWYTPGSDGQPLPSLALAAFLNLRERSWDPKIIDAQGRIHVSDYDDQGETLEKVFPGRILLDERAVWQQATPRNFVHVSPAQLQQWDQEGGNPHLVGRVVFIGYVAAGSGDLGTTPLNTRVPKVSLHAMALNAILQNAWFLPTSWWCNGLLALLLILAARPHWLPCLSGNLAGLALGAAVPLYTHWFLPWVSLLLTWNLCCFGEYWLAARLRQQRLLEMQKLADSDDPLILKVLGAYQVVRKLGTGGFATVYQALPTDTLDISRSVAIKIVHPAAAENQEFRRRFRREIRISSQLHHPHIVEVHPSGDESSLLYLTMELLEGRPLRDFLSEGQAMEESQVLSLIRPMLEALDYAHQKSVVHRDLKPENVMVRTRSLTPPWEFYDLKLVDFGLAFDSQASQLTRSGEIFGTLDYLAPERIQGSNDDPRSDLYAIGVMAYEMLSGQNPFKHSNPGEAILFRLTQDAPHLSELCPQATARLVHLIMALLARDPEQRPATAREVLNQL
ncbi:MAG: protein kinase [Candidatus Eremiobacteraeota bacterium]|nr:protein kinase [Candidatus Eremiobacteraeota bacterium]